MRGPVRLIDEIFGEIFEKDLLSEIVCITVSRESMEQLKRDYAEEFEMQLLESGRKVSDHDLRDHFGKPIFIMEQNEGKKYTLLRQL